MQNMSPQEIISSTFKKAKNYENVIHKKAKDYGKNIPDSQVKGVLKQIEITALNHVDKIVAAEKTMRIDSLVKKNMSYDMMDALQDIEKDLINQQMFYNENLISITNPYVRQIFTQMRDDEMRFITIIQQNIESLKSKPTEPNSIVYTTPRENK
ncbi:MULTISPECIES: hypothetical protein [Thermoanaerobacterium]|uniref:DUF2383 domain-containing protein n=1 Tax=Thermoanaerobacterium xylanolyticum (strain ATCC 49914 / DSM 7097 / LX-11) TaxID=858215 RepID=F6BKC7_THEXL|nr:hypothetical protein [Thermoanaerobacterium xylanolyticum]AEF18074.1 hypothetical protein Thexy_2061 [Thermoanaerobacterium xylanolyticum LX-11]